MTKDKSEIYNILTGTGSWINSIIKLCDDSKSFPFNTTGVLHYSDVLVKKPTETIKLDVVSIIQVNCQRSAPIAVGIDIKTNAHELQYETKMHEYCTHVEYFYLAIPSFLMPQAREFVARHNLSHIGILSIHKGTVKVHQHSNEHCLTYKSIAKLFQNLCMRQFKKGSVAPVFINQKQ